MTRAAGANYRLQEGEEQAAPRMLQSPVVNVLAVGEVSGPQGEAREGNAPTSSRRPATAAGAPGVSLAAAAVGLDEGFRGKVPQTQALPAAEILPTESLMAAASPVRDPPPGDPPANPEAALLGGTGSTVVTVTATLLPPPLLVVQRSTRKLQVAPASAPAADAVALAGTPPTPAPAASAAAASAGPPNRLPPVSAARGVPALLLTSPGRTMPARPVPMDASPRRPPAAAEGSGEARAVFRAAPDLGVVALHAREAVGGDAGEALAEAAALLQRRRAALARLEMGELLQKRSLALQQRQRRPDGLGYPGGAFPGRSEDQAYAEEAYAAGAPTRPEALGLHPLGRDRLPAGREGYIRQPLSLAASRWFAPQAASAAAAASVGGASSSVSSSSSSSGAAWGHSAVSGQRLPAASARVGTLPGLQPPAGHSEGRGQLLARIASLPPGWVVAQSHQDGS